MDPISIQEVELLSFFEVEPHFSEAGIPWSYNDASYQVELGPFVLRFSIAPAYKDLELSLVQNGAELYKLVALSVRDVRYHRRSDAELLEIVVTERESILVQLRPSISISQNVASAP